MDEKLKQIEDALNNLIGGSRNYDPRTEEGYRNIIDKLSEIRNSAKDTMWALWERISGMSINEVLDDLYRKATDAYNEANAKNNEMKSKTSEKQTEKFTCSKDEISNIVEKYLDETIGDTDMPLQKYKAIKQSLIDYTNWLVN